MLSALTSTMELCAARSLRMRLMFLVIGREPTNLDGGASDSSPVAVLLRDEADDAPRQLELRTPTHRGAHPVAQVARRGATAQRAAGARDRGECGGGGDVGP